MVILFLMLPVLLGSFVEKWTIPDGKNSYGRIVAGDSDHDGLTDIVVRRNQEIKVMFYELNLQHQWQLQDSIVNNGDHLLWALGDFDVDGRSDLCFQKTFGIPNVGIAVYESPDSFSYPTQEVWRDTVGQAAVVPICVYDVDQDMLPEIFDNNGSGQPHWIWIYESTGNNQYDTVYTLNPVVDTLEYCFNSTYAFGDFDGDSRVEFIAGELSGHYWVFESPGNNTYVQVHQAQLPTGNIKDCFTVPDADGDGKLEFVVKGFVIPTGEIHAFIFEATSDNTYEIIKTFTLWGGDYYGGYSDVGDVDGDSIPEIALEGRQTVHIIKAAGNDSFYVWQTLPGNAGGSSVRVYDVDGNGLCEVIISGNNETRIYEYEVGIAETPGHAVEPTYLQVSPNPFANTTTIRYAIHDSGCATQDRSLRIYDVTGRLVRSFYHESDIMDRASVFVWDGKDNQGRNLPNGVYIVRSETTPQALTAKIIKLR